jgi:hypothetical protein
MSLLFAKTFANTLWSFDSLSTINTRMRPPIKVRVHMEIKYHCASLGADVPSDQVSTGIMTSVIGSGAP